MHHTNYKNFEEAGQAILKFLHQHFNFALWMITRFEGETWIVLQSENSGYDIHNEQVFRWADSFCCKMVTGEAPNVATHSAHIPAYADAGINKLVQIKSYIGQPIFYEDGRLFGTLCAIDPHPQSKNISQDIKIVELLVNLLSNILHADFRQNEINRRQERLENEASIDVLTGLYNRRGWEHFLSAEEERCKRYGHPAAVFFIDLNDLKKINDQFGHAAGDILLQKTAKIMAQNVRSSDIIARLGGDEFVILNVENNESGATNLLNRLRHAFEQSGIRAAIGFAMRHPGQGLTAAVQQADLLMLKNKLSLKVPQNLN